MLKMSKWVRWGSIALFLLAVILLLVFCHENEQFLTVGLNEGAQYVPAPELTSEAVYFQTVPCLFDDVKRIGFQFANYGDRENSGTVTVSVFSAGEPVSSCELDAAQIPDGPYLYLELTRPVSAGEQLDIQISSDSPSGQGVTIWTTDNPILAKSGAHLTVNGEMQSTQLNMSFEYKSPKLSKQFLAPFVLCCFLLLATGVPWYYYEQYRENGRGKRLALYLLLLLGGTVILCLRDLQFISTPIIYGEDGFFLSRQLDQGILKTLFATRMGESNDFSNTGTYICIWLAQKINMLLNGYSLAAFPFWDGVMANLYIAFTATVGYRAFELLCGKKAGIAAYAAVVFMNLGGSAAEVLGRTLNTSFLWTVTVVFLLMIQYEEDNGFSAKSLLIGAACLVGAFTFPVGFLEIGGLLAAMAWRCVKDNAWKKRVFGNLLLIVTFAVGLFMLPRLLTSEGLGIDFTYKPEGAIEFFLARHILFYLVAPFYTKLSDPLTVALTALYMALVIWAAVVRIKKTKSLFNSYTVFAALALGTCFASAFMRRTMTQMFGDYVGSYPDRYYYACNILAFMLFAYAGCVVIECFRREKLAAGLCTALICLLLLDPSLFYFTKSNYGILYGDGGFTHTLAESCRAAVENAESIDLQGGIPVVLYPNGWAPSFSARYVIVTAADAQRD